ncbi:flavodoxin domain-containing protein [Marinospirillum sp.]|uniref:flavodoxin domain-containing protein n=1 Tax=Marinospirillum sp. TaxID=2183934 RepID=UPI00287094D8|nr:flavodoxin domain-containing protein [Marinospirillum sp.]MDR9467108.1 flavodoxin domain-containing protein [Marinospirillum sp.]
MASIKVLVGSVYGGSVEVAEMAAAAALKAGHQVEVTETPHSGLLEEADSLLVVTSTTGSGELPEDLLPVYQDLDSQAAKLVNKPFAVIALGDSSYGDSFCAAGKLMDEKLADLGGQQLLPLLTIDALQYFQAGDGAEDWIAAWVAKLNERD